MLIISKMTICLWPLASVRVSPFDSNVSYGKIVVSPFFFVENSSHCLCFVYTWLESHFILVIYLNSSFLWFPFSVRTVRRANSRFLCKWALKLMPWALYSGFRSLPWGLPHTASYYRNPIFLVNCLGIFSLSMFQHSVVWGYGRKTPSLSLVALCDCHCLGKM